MATRTRRKWKLDSQGQYARQIGWKQARNGSLVQHKFRLGSDLSEAKHREQRLREFWGRIESTRKDGLAEWTPFTLEIAKQLAKGEYQVKIPRQGEEDPGEYARRIHRVQNEYPMVAFVAEDEAAYAVGAYASKLVAEVQTQAAEMSQLDQMVFQNEALVREGYVTSGKAVQKGPRLHQAMRDYIAWIKEDYFRPELGRINDNGRNKIRQVETLMTRHKNVPLPSIDFAEVEKMIRFWRQRPTKQGTKRPIARKSAQNYIGELKRFFRWLHQSGKYDWRKPEDFNDIKTTVDPAPSDQQRRLAQVDTFTLDELVLLNKYATPLERVILLLGINCGFNTAETATLQGNEVFLFQGHSQHHQELLNFKTSDADSFVKRVRRKNGVYGEFLLFPQTVDALQWAHARRNRQPNPKPDTPLLLNDNAEPYNKPTEQGNRNHQLPNRFTDLLRRIRNDGNDIAKLSVGKLRKTAGDLVRRFSGGEVAAVFLCHGQPVQSDDLADVYTNRPFGRVFEALRKVQEHLQPMFEAAGSEPFTPPPQAYTGRKVVDRIRQLHDAGRTAHEIAKMVDVSRATVYRYIQRFNRG